MTAFKWNIRPTRAVAVLAALAILAIVLSTAFWLWDLRGRELEHARLETESVTRLFVETTRQSFESTDILLKSVQERLENPYATQLALDSMPVHLLLNTRAFGIRHLNALFLIDANGIAVNTSRETPDTSNRTSRSEREYFQAFARDRLDGLFIGKPVHSAVDQSWTLHLARNVKYPDGRFRGVIVAAINLPHFEQLYSLLTLDYNRPVALYLTDGTLVASRPPQQALIGQKDSSIANAIAHYKGDQGQLFFSTRSARNGRAGEDFTIGPVAGYPFVVSVIDEENIALASWRETAIPITTGALLIALFIGAVALVLIKELRKEEHLAAALTEANDRYHQTVDSVMDAIVGVDAEQHIRLFNPAAEGMFGYKAEEVMGKSLASLIPQRMHGGHEAHVQRFKELGGEARTMAPQLEVTGRRKDGSEFPIESTISHTLIGGHHQLTAVLRDVTERRRAERELREMNQQLRGLSASLENVREEERSRIAHELHDELGQQLTGLKLDLSWLNSRAKDGRPIELEKVADMRQMLDTAIASVRRISTELRPLILDDLGFGEALAWQTREFTKRSGITTKLDLQAEELVSDSALATALFRIVQESLTNIARHAEASEVDIRLVNTGKNLRLMVGDNGQGMDTQAKRTGFGLVGMRERARALGGEFRVISQTGLGTIIEVNMPLACNVEAEEIV